MQKGSDGSIVILAKHPKGSLTWHWAISMKRDVSGNFKLWLRAAHRKNQWHDYVRLPFGWCLIISRQDYHTRTPNDDAAVFVDPSPDGLERERNRPPAAASSQGEW